MADADLATLGQTAYIFLNRSRKLLQEQENLAFLPEMTLEFANSQVRFLIGHKYNTPEAEELFPYKKQNATALMMARERALNVTN
jgi:hypothetical protein